jgi:hypothetical protein
MNHVGEDFSHHNITIAASFSFKDPAVEIPVQLQELKVGESSRMIAFLYYVASAIFFVYSAIV